MNCSPTQLENAALRPDEQDGRGSALGRINHILNLKQIDLGELTGAISAVPGFAFRLCRSVTEPVCKFGTVSDAAVLAGRAGIQLLIDDYMRNLPAPIAQRTLFVVGGDPRSTEAQFSSTHDRIRLARL